MNLRSSGRAANAHLDMVAPVALRPAERGDRQLITDLLNTDRRSLSDLRLLFLTGSLQVVFAGPYSSYGSSPQEGCPRVDARRDRLKAELRTGERSQRD